MKKNKPYLIISKECDEIQINIKRTKPYMKLQQENQQLKEELQKADSITQSCIFEGKEESTINFRECLNKLKLYKEVIEEVRERVVELKKRFKQEEHQGTAYDDDLEYDELLQILDKVKENK